MAEFTDVLLTHDEIKNAVDGVAYRINQDYVGKDVVVVCILKGAFIFCADLVRSLTIPVTIDFIAASSYGAESTSSGNVKILKDVETDVAHKHVILVEDIVDTGLTLKTLKDFFMQRNPESVSICCLLDKRERRTVDVDVEYCCFPIPDDFVVGYGLDYDNRYRNLKDIMILDPSVYEKKG
ncbi:hypoxanthine phosphoribosyltransferase [Eubacteriales bacterium OttesenSCG-928-M02]|nr:hypoxanthine phosphoribosyltransferase [Eubacteriales bacterium OttesenSCG-928-M02]